VRRVVLASSNAGKLAELRALLADCGFELQPQSEFGVAPIEETGATFAANALLKARHAATVTGLAALADDSGLEVDALDGAPGVHSARYAGPAASDRQNNAKLLAALAGRERPHAARYRCVIAYLEHALDSAPVLCAGSWEGAIASAPRGHGGFGYDPLFLVAGDAAARTAAELAPEEKNRRSHRAQALTELRSALQKRGAS
jgi:XTP/dITP diphosphohydrolase